MAVISNLHPITEMSDRRSTHYALSRMLRETFGQLDLNESTCLVGIIYDSQIRFMDSFWTLRPLEPDEAARLVGILYGHSDQRLLQRFRDNWGFLKTSELASNMIDELATHELIDEIVPYE